MTIGRQDAVGYQETGSDLLSTNQLDTADGIDKRFDSISKGTPLVLQLLRIEIVPWLFGQVIESAGARQGGWAQHSNDDFQSCEFLRCRCVTVTQFLPGRLRIGLTCRNRVWANDRAHFRDRLAHFMAAQGPL